MSSQIPGIEDAQTLAQAIVDTIHEPFLVLDAASSFWRPAARSTRSFRSSPQQTIGCLLYDLGDGQWDIPALRVLLETIIPEHTAMDGFEVEHDFPGLGQRIMLLNARKVIYETSRQLHDPAGLHRHHRAPGDRAREGKLLARTEELLRQKQCCCRRCSTGWPTACRSSPAS
jgi:hypothetical protein